MNEFMSFTTSKIKDAQSYRATKLTESVILRTEEDDSIEPVSIIELFNKVVLRSLKKPALAFKDSQNQWRTITYQEYHENVIHFAKVFIKLGLKERKTVSILSSNCPEWHCSEIAGIFAGGVATGIYTTNSIEAICHVINTSETFIAVVDDARQMEKIHSNRYKMPHLKVIIQIHGPYEDYVQEKNGYFKWSDLREWDVADEATDLELTNRLNNIVVNECCCLIYTSGTVGFPKAVMLNHDGLVFDAKRIACLYGDYEFNKERFVSYLPLSHVAAQVFDIFIPLVTGGCVYFGDKDALKGSMIKTFIKARPTILFGVPRVWEKIHEKLIAIKSENYLMVKIILNFAKQFSLNYYLSIMEGQKPWLCPKYWLAKKLLAGSKEMFGLDKCKVFLTGGAPTLVETKRFFLEYDIQLLEIFGMSETSGGVCFGLPEVRDFDTIGKAIKGVNFRVDSPDENNSGELCVKGRTNFMGYANEIDKTNETIDKYGWIYTGDVGSISSDKYIYITGRKKEIIITSGGENVPPIRIENLVKSQLPGVSNAFLIGDRRKYLTMLLSIKTQMNPLTGEPLDDLQLDSLNWMKELDLNYTKLSEILEAGPCPKVLQSIQNGINIANSKAISNAQKIQKFNLIPCDFSVPGGELGPTLKSRRAYIAKKYSKLIETFYE